MEIDKFILNIPQLRCVIKNTKEDYINTLKGEIRVIGLREKIENRLITINKIEKILTNHKD